MIDEARTNLITTEIVRQAIGYVHLKNDPVMLHEIEGGHIPDECTEAIERINSNRAAFEQWVQDTLDGLPRIKEFFGNLIESRLKQDGVLQCPIFGAICYNDGILENRLERIKKHVSGVESLIAEYGSQHDSAQIDAAIVDMTAEILVLDFMIQLGFSDIRKVPQQRRAHIDIQAQYNGKPYAIEVTRGREVKEWETLPYGGLEDCDNVTNQLKICRLLSRIAYRKDDQFERALKAGACARSATKVVAIKTSDFGFAQCVERAQKIASELLTQIGAPANVDCVWLVPNVQVAESRWACKNRTDTATSPHIEL